MHPYQYLIPSLWPNDISMYGFGLFIYPLMDISVSSFGKCEQHYCIQLCEQMFLVICVTTDE